MLRSEPNWQWVTTIPDYYNFWYVFRGSGTMVVNGTPHRLQAGTAFVLAPGQQITALHNSDDPIHNFAAHVHVLNARGQRMMASEFPMASVPVRDAALFETVARHVVRLHQTDDIRSHNLADTWTHALLCQVIRDAALPTLDPVDQRIMHMADRMGAEPGQATSIEALAREAGFSRAHFTRRFTRVMGVTPSRYLIRRRIDRATQLIQQSPLKMAEIAERLGYSDVYFFSRQFKSVTGFAPSLLRKHH